MVAYVTFNYDTLLERACLHEAQLSMVDLTSYISHDRLKVFKPHGSINWAHPLVLDPPPPNVNDRDYVIQNAIRLNIPEEFVLHEGSAGSRGLEAVPALAVPIESKAVFECPPDHISLLKELLPEVDRLLIIGWRATERNFTALLRACSRELRSALVACAGEEESASTARRICDARGSMAVRGFQSWENRLGFSDLVGSEEMEKSLT